MISKRRSLTSSGAIRTRRPSRPSADVSRISSGAPKFAAQAVNAICIEASIGHDASWLLPTSSASCFAEACSLSAMRGAPSLGMRVGNRNAIRSAERLAEEVSPHRRFPPHILWGASILPSVWVRPIYTFVCLGSKFDSLTSLDNFRNFASHPGRYCNQPRRIRLFFTAVTIFTAAQILPDARILPAAQISRPHRSCTSSRSAPDAQIFTAGIF